MIKVLQWLNANQGFVMSILTAFYVSFTGWIIWEMRRDRKERKRIENETYFKNLFNKAQNTLFKEIKELVDYSTKIKEELTDLDINKMLQKLPYQLFIEACTLPPDKREAIISKIAKDSLSRLEKYPEKQLQDIEDFFKIHTLKYDKRLQKSILKIHRNSEKLQHVRSNYNNLILPSTNDYFTGRLMEDAGYEMPPQVVETVKRIVERYTGKKIDIAKRILYEDLTKKRRYKNDIINAKKKILKLIRKIEKYHDKFTKIAEFYSVKYVTI